ncbi:MAG: hypothetical protein EOM85_01240 [Candidatus Moranbacteria bacterium]|nr:hypothetical protein [Candidatus Moranbacteria bacterium]
MKEFTSFIIKPDGMVNRSAIRDMILKSGLVITESKILLLPKWAIEILYDNVPANILVAKEEYFSSPVEVGLIEGENAIETFFELCGSKTRPSECDPGTIRAIFGKASPTLIKGVDYFLNAIHRPNREEAVKNIELIKSLLL